MARADFGCLQPLLSRGKLSLCPAQHHEAGLPAGRDNALLFRNKACREDAEPHTTFQHQPLGPGLNSAKVSVKWNKDAYLLLPAICSISLLQVSVPAARAGKADTSTSHLSFFFFFFHNQDIILE